MNKSLYEISDELLAIFNTIEANDGEVTEEQLEELNIAEEQLYEKLASYKKAIRVWEADINACKEEEKRIKTARSVKENRINKLKDRMLFAVQRFGYTGKPNAKGKCNKFYELSDGRIFTKTIESVEIDENRTNILINLFVEYCKLDQNPNGEIVFEDRFYEDFLQYANENIKAVYEGQIEFTIDDLKSCVFEYTHRAHIVDIYDTLRTAIINKSEISPVTGLKYDSDKASLKLRLNAGQELTVAKLKETESITIK